LAEEKAPAQPPRKPRRGLRHSLLIALAIVVGFVVYAFAFEKTHVSLDQIQSETRQQQLFRILRALAHPDLIHYDTKDAVVEAPVFVPCPAGGAPPAETPPEGGPTVTVEPACGAPGETVTIRGSGFRAESDVSVQFVPRSEFDITLPIDKVTTTKEGTFEVAYELPDRTSDQPQAVRTIAKVPIGTWRHRVEVWTDTNGNGVRDPTNLSDGEVLGVSTLPLPEFKIRSPGGVALMDDNGNPLEFLSWGGSFEASTGTAKGLTSHDLGLDPLAVGTDESFQRVGPGKRPDDFTWAGPSPASFGRINDGQEPDRTLLRALPFINEIAFADHPEIEVAGAPGASLKGMTLIFFDGADGSQYKTVKVADQIDLSPRLSANAIHTWDRIVETVMLAFLATTVGTLLAVPLSFVAARNIMRDIAVPMINLALVILGIPVGIVFGIDVAHWAERMAAFTKGNWLADILVGVVLLFAIWRAVLWAVDVDEGVRPSVLERLARLGTLVLGGIGFFVALYLLADTMLVIGTAATIRLGFLADFVSTLGEILAVIVPVVAALVGAGVMAQVGSRIGYLIRTRLARPVVVALTYPLAAAAGGAVALFIGAVIDWFGQFENPVATVYVPAAVGAAFGLLLAFRARDKEGTGIGLVLYYIARTIFNALRSIEPLVMVIVFVVWVGIGPFAGSLALALHTTAALAKLYSEQVESILPGPVEAIRATGATRMQTVVYAVVPQIVPPYISFTMYRWDINVRMSTIIGFAGGGGIGFLLQQNINLLQYQQAAAQMLAIAIVVASMDYLSSRLRERVV